MAEDYGLWKYNTTLEKFKEKLGEILKKYGLDENLEKEFEPKDPYTYKAVATLSDGVEVPIPAYSEDDKILTGEEVPYDTKILKLRNIVTTIKGVNDKHKLENLEFTSSLRKIDDSFQNCELLKTQNIQWNIETEYDSVYGITWGTGVTTISNSFYCGPEHLNRASTSVDLPLSVATISNSFAAGYENLTGATIRHEDYVNVLGCSFDNNSVSRSGVDTITAYSRLAPDSKVCGLTKAGRISVPSKWREFYENDFSWRNNPAKSKIVYR